MENRTEVHRTLMEAAARAREFAYSPYSDYCVGAALLAEDGRIVPILFCSYAVYAERGLLTDLQPSRDNVFYYTLGKTLGDILISE